MNPSIRDYRNSIQAYENRLKKLENDTRISAKNRKIAIKWVKQKEKDMQQGMTLKDRDEDAHRRSKTLTKYCYFLRNIGFWFPDFEKITKKDIEKFKVGFYDDTIKSIDGKPLKSKSEFITKILKSDFFKYIGKYDLACAVFNHKIKKESYRVEFLELEDIELLVEKAAYDYQKVALWVLFSTGMRVGEMLNMKKKDFEYKRNPKTKTSYYAAHIKKEYTKSREDRAVPIVIPEANQALFKYLKKLKANDFLFPNGYGGMYKFLKDLYRNHGIKTKPNGEEPTIHTLRKSVTLYWLNNGYSSDQVKAMLGHKPSSNAIDIYLNYSGVSLEPEVTRVQTDELIKMQQALKENEERLVFMQQAYDKVQEDMKDFKDEILLLFEKKVKALSRS